ncbi:hypothetical protein B0H65DRAFT_91992 [Neurospora tetraspora]|uniref:Uncharacterized protein n=1 Tax=Neurospora tetraspora TaxID=94610 RepID=A0AAE0JJL5_9PEZI|nr:hypothetical protein B0H65DRAFT_91992 [Neurospora tetraspora]
MHWMLGFSNLHLCPPRADCTPLTQSNHHGNNQSINAHLTALSGVFNFFRSKQTTWRTVSDFSFFVAFRSAHPSYDKVAFSCFAQFGLMALFSFRCLPGRQSTS